MDSSLNVIQQVRYRYMARLLNISFFVIHQQMNLEAADIIQIIMKKEKNSIMNVKVRFYPPNFFLPLSIRCYPSIDLTNSIIIDSKNNSEITAQASQF